MSDDEHGETSNAQLLSTELKEGQLEIVEVTEYEKNQKIQSVEEHVLLEGSENSGDCDLKYMQVLDPGKGMMVDLLNLTLVRCENGQESYQLVSNADTSGSNETDATVTCVLQSSDDGDDQESGETYVMVDGSQGPLVFLQAPIKKPQVVKPAPTPGHILEKVKVLQKVKNQLATVCASAGGEGAGGGGAASCPHHTSCSPPHFKLFLYSCKLCSFRCNAIKELTAHKASEHGGGGGNKGRGGFRSSSITLQCARCPFRGCTHSQLMRHVQEKHVIETQETNKVYLDSAEVEAADVLVCGACGFESSSRAVFKKHIEDEHGATTC